MNQLIQPSRVISLADPRQWMQSWLRVRLILESGRPYLNAPKPLAVRLALHDGRFVNENELAWKPQAIDYAPIPPPAAIVAEQWQAVSNDDRLPGDPPGWWRPVGARGIEIDRDMIGHATIGYLKPGSRIVFAAYSFDFGTMERPPF